MRTYSSSISMLPNEMPENAIAERIIKCAIEVHKQLGPGLLESIYEEALTIECELDGLTCLRQVKIPVIYKGRQIGEHRPDLLINDLVIVENKSVERYDPVFEAQILTYLRLRKNALACSSTSIPA